MFARITGAGTPLAGCTSQVFWAGSAADGCSTGRVAAVRREMVGEALTGVRGFMENG